MQKQEQNPQLVVMTPTGCREVVQPPAATDEQQEQHHHRRHKPPPLTLESPTDQPDQHHHPNCQHHRQLAAGNWQLQTTSTSTLCVCQHSPMSASSASSTSSACDPRQLTPMTLSPCGRLSQPSPMSETDADDTLTSLDAGQHADDTSAGAGAGQGADEVFLANPDHQSDKQQTQDHLNNGQRECDSCQPASQQRALSSQGKCTQAAPPTKRLVFGTLPKALWLRVMGLLDMYDRFQMTQTCLLFRQLFFHPQLWQRVELVCSVGALPPTTAATVGEREEAPVCLRPSHKKIVAEFGHIFQDVKLHFADSRRNLEPETQQILMSLADRWKVQSLKLSTSFEELAVVGGPLGATRYTRSGRKVAVEMIRKAKDLRYLDLSEWPIFVAQETSHFQFPPNPDLLLWDAIGAERERGREINNEAAEESLVDLLVEPDTCPQLCSLNVARRTFPYHGLGHDTQSLTTELRFPDYALRLANSLRHVRHLTLTLRQTMITDALLAELAFLGQAQAQAQTNGGSEGQEDQSISRRLRVVNCDPLSIEAAAKLKKDKKGQEVHEDSNLEACPVLSEKAWRTLSAACHEGGEGGGLEVEAVAEVYNVPALRWLFRSYVPLVSLSLLSCSVPPALLRAVLQCRTTLRSLCCHILPRKGLDVALLEVAEGCIKLRHLVFFGSVRSSTVLAIAAIDRQWVTFHFRRRFITFPTAGTDGKLALSPARSPADASGDDEVSSDSPSGDDVCSLTSEFPPPEPSVPGNAEIGKIGATFFASPQQPGQLQSGNNGADLDTKPRSENNKNLRNLSSTYSVGQLPTNVMASTVLADQNPKLQTEDNPFVSKAERLKPCGSFDGQPCSCAIQGQSTKKRGSRDDIMARMEREIRRKMKLDQLSEEVSTLLGYTWEPSDL